MVVVAQLVRVVVCGAAGRRFEPGQPPRISKAPSFLGAFFVFKSLFRFAPSVRPEVSVLESGFRFIPLRSICRLKPRVRFQVIKVY